MRKFLASLVMSLLLVVPAKAGHDWHALARWGANSVVHLHSDGDCTGTISNVKERYIVTAVHCKGDNGEPITADSAPTVVVKEDLETDLLVLQAATLDPKKTALELSSNNARVADEVLSVGYAMGLNVPHSRSSMIAAVGVELPEEFFLDVPVTAYDNSFVNGQSGGPVINTNGYVVSIVQRAYLDAGYGVDAATIKAKTGQYWGK